jgi:cytochrome c553
VVFTNSGTPANPKLAQQHPDYIVKQLQEFKSGKRPNPIMQGFAAQLSDQDMRNIAAFIVSQKNKTGFAKDKELVSLGEKLSRGGAQNRQLPACSGCHSPNGAGIPAQYPRLSGQHADYTASQLVAFRDGVRKNSPQMSQIASKLNDREIRAVFRNAPVGAAVDDAGPCGYDDTADREVTPSIRKQHRTRYQQ